MARNDYGVGTTETIRRCGGIGITLERGQHEYEEAPRSAIELSGERYVSLWYGCGRAEAFAA